MYENAEPTEPEMMSIMSKEITYLTNAPPKTARFATHMLIGMKLNHCSYQTRIGNIASNLAIFLQSPTGSFKTPTMTTLREIASDRDTFPEFYGHIFESYTSEGLGKYTSDWLKEKDDDVEINRGKTFYGIVMRDEASDIPKNSSGKGRGGNIYEFNSKLIDGRVYSNLTIRGGNEVYPPVWFSLFMATTETFSIT
jgi:hypothetical protein